MKKYKVTLIQRKTYEVEAYDEQDAFEKATDEAEVNPNSLWDLSDYYIEEMG